MAPCLHEVGSGFQPEDDMSKSMDPGARIRVSPLAVAVLANVTLLAACGHEPPGDAAAAEREPGAAADASRVSARLATTKPRGSSGGAVSCANQWWDGSHAVTKYVRGALFNGMFHGRPGWDTDIVMPHSPVQLRHPSKLIIASPGGRRTCCGYVPRFQDMKTGELFQFVHLQTIHVSTKDQGRVFPAGFVVGTSGGDTPETNCSRTTCGSVFAHLCVQSQAFSGNHDGDMARSVGPLTHDRTCR